MKKITKVTDADVGRIAVSEDGYFRLKIIKGENNQSTVKFLKATPAFDAEKVLEGFGLIGGARTMYWEEEKPKTLFRAWCEENGYDPEGDFIYDTELSGNSYNFSFKDDAILKIAYDDNSRCPKFSDRVGNEKFEYFDKQESGVVLKQCVKAAKPRFHKKRQKPPVRQKTDIVIHYKTGEKYTIKNVLFIHMDEEITKISVKKELYKGIENVNTSYIENNLISHIRVKSVSDTIDIEFCHLGGVVKTNDTASVVKFWSRVFK